MAELRKDHSLGSPALAILTAATLVGLVGLVVFTTQGSGDYNLAAPVGGNNAAPGIQALLHGSLAGYAAHQPVVGLTSIVLRLPFVALAYALGATAFQGYQAGALACLLPLVLCGAWLVSAPRLTPRQRLLRFLTIAIVIQSPITHSGLASGHPEGILSTLLGTLAVVVAMGGRARWAAVLLGLAVSSKETGVIALLPVMVALPGRRREVAAIAGGVVFLLCTSVWLMDLGAFVRSLHGEGGTRFLTPYSLLWPVSAPLHIGHQLSVARVMPAGLTRVRASALTLLAAGAALAMWFGWAHRRGAVCQPLVLLVLMGLLRCMCDSTHEAYYWITLLIPMAAWEALEDSVPVKTLLLGLAVLVLFASLGRVAPAYLYTVSAGGELLLVQYLARRAMPLARTRQAMTDAVPLNGGPAWALARVPGGRQHDLSAVSSRSLAPEPMVTLCDAPSIGS